MKRLILLFAAVLLAGCAATRPAVVPPELFADHLFAPPRQQLGVEEIFALTPQMKRYARQIYQRRGGEEPRRALFNALYRREALQLDYDSARTRTAAEAFAARQGNCLSLVIMTAALAREIDVPVVLQEVPGNAAWSRSGSLYLNSGHVNLQLGRAGVTWEAPGDYLLIDFLPPVEGRRSLARPITRTAVAAMFMNNRAAEALADGDVDEAYWWARNAIVTAPALTHAYNTLAVVHRRHGDTARAEATLRHALRAAPDDIAALANLVRLLEDEGRAADAAAPRSRLAALQPDVPFHFYDLGQRAMAAGDYAAARRLFERELRRDPDYHAFHFAAAQAALALGDMAGASRHLQRANATSGTASQRDLYTAKLDRLRAPLH